MNVIYTQPVIFFSPQQSRSAMDAYVALLEANPSTNAYVIVYGGRFECRNEAEQIIRMVRAYLVLDKKIDERRIISVNGKHRERSQIDMLLVMPDVQLPKPSYYLEPWEVKNYPSDSPRCRNLRQFNARRRA